MLKVYLFYKILLIFLKHVQQHNHIVKTIKKNFHDLSPKLGHFHFFVEIRTFKCLHSRMNDLLLNFTYHNYRPPKYKRNNRRRFQVTAETCRLDFIATTPTVLYYSRVFRHNIIMFVAGFSRTLLKNPIKSPIPPSTASVLNFQYRRGICSYE